jgi:LmbE family N-acetylglucosaminyl deacetylase
VAGTAARDGTADPTKLGLDIRAYRRPPDDIEIGCAGTLLNLIEQNAVGEVRWVVLSGVGERSSEARRSAEPLLDMVPRSQVVVRDFPDGFLPLRGPAN